MSMITLINQAKESAKLEFEAIANKTYDHKAETFSETLQDGSVVSCVGVCAANAFSTTVGNIRITWKLNGNRATGAVIEKLFLSIATEQEKKEIKAHIEKTKWLKKFGL